METIIALLFVLLPIILKLIGRKLEKSGKSDQAARMRKVAEELGVDPDEGDFAKWFREAELEAEREAELEAAREAELEAELPGDLVERVKVERVHKEKPELVLRPEVRKVEKFVPKGAVPASQKHKKEKIDPKKLVVYSEIMKPKYTE